MGKNYGGEEANYARNGSDIAKKIIIGISIALTVSWMGWISLRGVNAGDTATMVKTNEVVATVKEDVAVLKANHTAMKDDISEIKAASIRSENLLQSIRGDQIRRQKAGQ